ncbi:hypothetical protein [Secundilactobacillus folii]|nr:hypothetical protein [Secundilactobacillus folii]
MHNDTDDSYTFSLRHEGQDDDFIEFYLAKIHLADDNYMYAIYVTGPQSMLDDNRYFYPDSQHCPIIFVDNSSEPVDIDSIESNFDISEVKDFNMKVENQY